MLIVDFSLNFWNVQDVFVFYGALRSGSTLMRLMLNAHPDIHCPGERDFMLDALVPGPGGDLVLDSEALEGSRIFRAANLSVPDTRDGAEAFYAMLEEDRARTGKRVHVIVLHRGLPQLMQVMPEARFIHLLRDPRDIARSSIGMGWAGNTWYGIDHWLKTESAWAAQGVPEAQVHTLKYEHLLEAPAAELQRLCDFMGLAYTEAMLDYADGTTYEPVDPKLAYQWTRKQSADEVSDSEFKAADLMRAQGYTFSDQGPRAPSALRRAKLAWQNKLAVWRTRIQRYGVIDPLLVAWGYRGGPKGLSRPAQRRIDAKEVKYLR